MLLGIIFQINEETLDLQCPTTAIGANMVTSVTTTILVIDTIFEQTSVSMSA